MCKLKLLEEMIVEAYALHDAAVEEFNMEDAEFWCNFIGEVGMELDQALHDYLVKEAQEEQASRNFRPEEMW